MAKVKTMTPNQFIAARKSLKLTQGELAELFEVSLRTIIRIEGGELDKRSALAMMYLISTLKD